MKTTATTTITTNRHSNELTSGDSFIFERVLYIVILTINAGIKYNNNKKKETCAICMGTHVELTYHSLNVYFVFIYLFIIFHLNSSMCIESEDMKQKNE